MDYLKPVGSFLKEKGTATISAIKRSPELFSEDNPVGKTLRKIPEVVKVIPGKIFNRTNGSEDQ